MTIVGADPMEPNLPQWGCGIWQEHPLCVPFVELIGWSSVVV